MDFSVISLQYYACFGKGDYSDTMEWEVELTEEQQVAFKKAVMTQTELDDVEELSKICDAVYPEIEQIEIENCLELDDEFAKECLGEAEVDPEEINDLVHSGDKYTIEYFGLGNMSEEELEDWDANDLEELPLIRDFKEDFEPGSPFDYGWSLNVVLPDVSEMEIDSENIEDYLRELKVDGDEETISAVIDAVSDFYESDEFESLEEFFESI